MLIPCSKANRKSMSYLALKFEPDVNENDNEGGNPSTTARSWQLLVMLLTNASEDKDWTLVGNIIWVRLMTKAPRSLSISSGGRRWLWPLVVASRERRCSPQVFTVIAKVWIPWHFWWLTKDRERALNENARKPSFMGCNVVPLRDKSPMVPFLGMPVCLSLCGVRAL